MVFHAQTAKCGRVGHAECVGKKCNIMYKKRPWLRFIEGVEGVQAGGAGSSDAGGSGIGEGSESGGSGDSDGGKPDDDDKESEEEEGESDSEDSQSPNSEDAWKSHARKWEDRARKNLKDLEAAQAELAARPSRDDVAQAKAEAEAERKENAVFRGLLGLDADAREIGALLDSKSFEKSVAELDPEDEGFQDALKAASVQVLKNFQPTVEPFNQSYSADRGDELYQLLHGKPNE